MFSSHVKGPPLEGTAAVPPSSAPRERELSRSERKASRLAEERQARALREAERQAAKARKAVEKSMDKGSSVAARATAPEAGPAPDVASAGTLAPERKAAGKAPRPEKPGKERKPGKEKARKTEPGSETPGESGGDKPAKDKGRGVTIKLARHPQESRPKAPLQPTVILKPKPSRRELAARAAQADPFTPPQKAGVDLALVALVLGTVALALSWVPIVKYVAAAFAAGGILLAVLDTRRGAAEGWLPGVMIRWARTLSVAALVVVVMTMLMAVRAGADAEKKASGNATSAVLDDDLGTKWGEFTETKDSIGVTHRGLLLTVKNKSGDINSFDVLVEAVNANGERITSEQLLVRNMKKGEEKQYNLFQFSDDLTAKALKTAEFRVGNVRMY